MKKPRSLRGLLMAFALAVTAPLLVALAVFLWRTAEASRADLEENILQTAGDLAADINRTVALRFAVLNALAVSAHLQDEDWPKFYEEAKRLTEEQARIVLIDTSLRQIINTGRPYGQAPPLTGDPETARQILKTKQRAVSNLFISLVTRKPSINIDVPILKDGEVRYILIYGAAPETLLSLGQYLPKDFVSAVWDANDVVLARSRDNERHVGKPLPAELAGLRDGISKNHNLDGVEVLRAVKYLDEAPWRVSVSVPTTVITASIVRALTFWVAAILVAASIAALLAFVFSRALARPLSRAAAAAAALTSGETVPLESAGIREVDQVTEALRQAGEREKVLIGELRHRVRNILSVAQALVGRTLSEAQPMSGSLRAEVAGRLQALAEAHELLVKSDRQGVPISELIKTELEFFGNRIEIEGPDLLLQPSAVQSLALIVHELITNAAKHGALSIDSGKVRVTWALKGTDGDRRFHFFWQETGGPPTRMPLRKGLGTTLLKMAIAGDGVAPSFTYGEEGFSYSFNVAMSAIGTARDSSSLGDAEQIKQLRAVM
jgi:two-component sensor histidine kinase